METIEEKVRRKIRTYKENKRNWEKLKNHINKLKIGELFTFDSLRKICGIPIHCDLEQLKRKSTLDMYIHYLTKTGIINFTTIGTYKKLTNIPEKTGIVHLKMIMLENQENEWKEWFIPLHERLGVTEEELYGENNVNTKVS